MKDEKLKSKIHNLSKTTKVLLVVGLFAFSFSAFQIFDTILADHNTVTKTLLAAPNQMISLRDIANTESTTISVSVDVDPGNELVITVTDPDADLDTGTLDIVFSSATSTTSGAATATATLTETGVNTGLFNGTITLSSSTTTGSTLEADNNDQFSVSYSPHPLNELAEQETVSQGTTLGLARAKATVDLATGGDVTMTDIIIDSDTFQNLCFTPVIYPVEISFSNGAAQTGGTNMEVILSYANAIFNPGDIPAILKMYYKIPGFGWAVIRDNFNSEGLDTNAKTITSVPAQAGFLAPVSEGQFTLAFDTGCGGGGQETVIARPY